jgi:mono/diheme cytochrome c family protein
MDKGFILLFLAAVLATGCGAGGEEEAIVDREEVLRAARADSVAMAEAMYDATVFDTVSWESDGARWERGGVVWSFSCQGCHGVEGKGHGAVATEHGMAVPDLTVPEWRFRDDISGTRHRIFVGHESEMLSWGPRGLSYRDVDAAAHYIQDLLRAED